MFNVTAHTAFPIPRILKRKQRPQAFGAKIIRTTLLSYATALTVMASLCIGGYVVLENTIEENATSATQINVAGRQRMLAHRIALTAHSIANNKEPLGVQMRADIAKMEKAHRALIKGNAMGIKIPLSASGETFFFSGPDALHIKVENFLSEARAFLALKPGQARLVQAQTLATLARGSLFIKLDQAVSLFEREAGQRRAQLQKRHLLVVSVALLTLIAEALLIFQPLIGRLRTQLGHLYEAATRDSLTGLSNRQFFLDATLRDQALAKRHNQSCFLVFCDVDHLKAINECFGYDAGNKALKSFAQLLQQELRESDVPARIGGEEFAIAIRDATLKDTWAVAERLRAAAEQLDVSGVPPLTISIGITRLDHTETMESAFMRAQEALKQAKSAGRNTVATHL
ncbi:MAG: diguanylate cyclase [Pseudomonadota bacterium]